MGIAERVDRELPDIRHLLEFLLGGGKWVVDGEVVVVSVGSREH